MDNEEKILEMLTAMRTEMNEMRDTLTRVAVTQEDVVLPRIQTALEGYSELSRKVGTLATKEQVEKLAGEVSVIEEVVSQLKKAQ